MCYSKIDIVGDLFVKKRHFFASDLPFWRVIFILALEEKILKEGTVLPGNILKVDCFLNHQIDIKFMMEMGKEIATLYKDAGVTKILTIETSGIPIACAAAHFMDIPVVFAKKNKSSNISDDVYRAVVTSFTHKNVYDAVVSKFFLSADDNILIIDDFLAKGNAIKGLIDIINQAGAKLSGCAIAIEKGFQGGGDELRQSGVRVDSLAIVEEMTETSLSFRKN